MDSPDDLNRLIDLRDRGLLTETEFETARRRLASMQPTGALPLGADPAAVPFDERQVPLGPVGNPPPTPAPTSPPPTPALAPPPSAAPPPSRGGLFWAIVGLVAVAIGLAALVGGFLYWQRNSARAMVAEADAALMAGEYATALDRYEAAIARWAEVPVRPERRAFAAGAVAHDLGDAALAEEDYTRAGAHFGDAVSSYGRALDGYGTSSEDAAGEVATVTARLTTARASEAYARGLEALARGDTAAAIGLLTSAQEIEDRPEIQAALGRAKARQAFDAGMELLQAGKWAEAADMLAQALALDNLPQYAAALETARAKLSSEAQTRLAEGLSALSKGDLATAVDLLGAIPSLASDAFDAAREPLAEARRRLGIVLGEAGATATPAPVPGVSDANLAASYALHYAAASAACQLAVEAQAGGAFEWTDGLLGRKFPEYRQSALGATVLTLAGGALRTQGADGAWRERAYTCDYDTGSGRVVAVAVQ